MIKVVSITGHRSLTKSSLDLVRRVAQKLVLNDSIDEILFGGAIGADTEFLKWCLKSRTGARPKLTAVVPNTVEHQPREAQTWINQADSIVELKLEITSEDRYQAYHVRNQYLVDHSSKVIAFWNGSFKSGTSSCMRYAKTKGVEVILIPVETY